MVCFVIYVMSTLCMLHMNRIAHVKQRLLNVLLQFLPTRRLSTEQLTHCGTVK